MGRLQRSFFGRPTLTVARELLGKSIVKLESSGDLLSATIVEVEAYIGETDLACHARHGRTQRNQVMFGPPGIAYVYFIYGMYWMFNIVTEHDGFPAAVLLRSVLPTEGIEKIRQRRGRPDPELSNGPAKITQAFGIGPAYNGYDLCAPSADFFLEDTGERLQMNGYETLIRVGIGSTPEPWGEMTWNYRLSGLT